MPINFSMENEKPNSLLEKVLSYIIMFNSLLQAVGYILLLAQGVVNY